MQENIEERNKTLSTNLLISRDPTAGRLLILLSVVQYETLFLKFNSKDEIRTVSENKNKCRIYLFWNKMNDVPGYSIENFISIHRICKKRNESVGCICLNSRPETWRKLSGTIAVWSIVSRKVSSWPSETLT